MKQQRKMQRDFSYGGYALFVNGEQIPSFVQVEGSKIVAVSIPKKHDPIKTEYLHSECLKYDLGTKRDINRLKRKGVVGFRYETPTETTLEY